jgi:hypothetical protein
MAIEVPGPPGGLLHQADCLPACLLCAQPRQCATPAIPSSTPDDV